jgi:hypothetical protein
LHILCDNRKEHSFEEWLVYELKGKLRKANVIAHHTHKPVILYRDTIEETSCASEEEVCLLAEDHIIVLLYVYGGFIPSEFQQVRIYTIEKFAKPILNKGRKDLLLQCLENLGEYE